MTISRSKRKFFIAIATTIFLSILGTITTYAIDAILPTKEESTETELPTKSNYEIEKNQCNNNEYKIDSGGSTNIVCGDNNEIRPD